jgi:hypothetical protein
MTKFLAIIFCFFCLSGYSQSLKNTVPSNEQVYIHTDKKAYVAGEMIWFKAYVMSEYTPSDLSKNMFVEIIDRSGNVIISNHLPIIWGTSSGNILLPLDLPEDVYILRAYTLIQAKKKEIKFNQVLPILNPSNNQKKIVVSQKSEITEFHQEENISIKFNELNPVELIISKKNENEYLGDLSLRGLILGKLVFDQPLKNSFPIKIKLPLNALPSSVLQVELVGNKKDVLAKKSTFVNNQDFSMEPKITTDSVSFNVGGSNVFNVDFLDSITGSFSFSVTDMDKELKSISQTNIVSTFLIPSHVQLPASTLLIKDSINKINDELSKMDFYNYSGVVDTVTSDLPYIQIKGWAFKKKGKVKEKEISFILQAKDSSTNFLEVPLDKDGKFIIEDLVYEDSATIYYQLHNELFDINIDYDPLPKIKNDIYLPQEELDKTIAFLHHHAVENVVANEIHKELLDANTKFKSLQEVVVTTRKPSKAMLVNKKYTSGMFSSTGNSKVMDLINDPPSSKAGNVFDYLQSKIAGLSITKKSATNYEVTSTRVMSLTGGKIPATIFLDEVLLSGTDMAASVPISQIAMVKYYTPGSLNLPSIGVAPVLVIYTKKYDDMVATDMTVNKFFKYPGYAVTTNFDDYSTDATGNYNTISTLFWEPEAIVQDDKKYTIRFVNHVGAKRMHLVFEGFTDKGKLIHIERDIVKPE